VDSVGACDEQMIVTQRTVDIKTVALDNAYKDIDSEPLRFIIPLLCDVEVIRIEVKMVSFCIYTIHTSLAWTWIDLPLNHYDIVVII